MEYLDINWEEEIICSYSGTQAEKLIVMLYREIDEMPTFSNFVNECYSFNEQKILDIIINSGATNEYDAECLVEEVIDRLQEVGLFTDLEKYIFEVLQKYSLFVVIDDTEEFSEFMQIKNLEGNMIIIGEAQNSLLSRYSVNGITCIQGYTIYCEKSVLAIEEAQENE